MLLSLFVLTNFISSDEWCWAILSCLGMFLLFLILIWHILNTSMNKFYLTNEWQCDTCVVHMNWLTDQINVLNIHYFRIGSVYRRVCMGNSLWVRNPKIVSMVRDWCFLLMKNCFNQHSGPLVFNHSSVKLTLTCLNLFHMWPRHGEEFRWSFCMN